MKTVPAIIEMASDGNYSIYMDADDMDYLVTKGMRILNLHMSVTENILKKLNLSLNII